MTPSLCEARPILVPTETAPRGQVFKRRQPAYPALDYFVYVPKSAAAAAPVLVAIHGMSRDALEQIECFRSLSELHGTILLAPYFDATSYPDYQRLGRRGRGLRADHALRAALLHFRGSLEHTRCFFFGFSGGAQFLHRFVMTQPALVEAAVIAAAGWYTFPDAAARYPYGMRVDGRLPGTRIRTSLFIDVPVLTVVGGGDTQRDRSLRRTRRLDASQGRNRLERAHRWTAAMRRMAGNDQAFPLSILDRVGHSFAESMRVGLGQRVFEFLLEARRA